MGHKFAEIAFTEQVREVQKELGSRRGYAAMDQGADYNHKLGQAEAQFIGASDSFYMASVSETDWPYVQHRGGPSGFMCIIDENTLGFADYSGNRQYVSTGNFITNDKVALFFMDYPSQTRLKLLGRIRQIEPSETQLLQRLTANSPSASVERGFVIQVSAFDWNCPKYITPRYNQSQVESMLSAVLTENKTLKQRQPSMVPKQLGNGPLALKVVSISQETAQVRSYRFKSTTGETLAQTSAGAHLRLPVILADGSHSVRDYSLSCDPEQHQYYQIAVQCEDLGDGGSIALQQDYQLGTIIHCAYPINEFRLHDDQRPALFIAGGIGITPIKAMLEALFDHGQAFELHYCGRSVEKMAFAEHLKKQYPAQVTLYSSSQSQRVDVRQLLTDVSSNTVIYVCGPQALLDEVHKQADALGIAAERVRMERFNRD